jgi:hypothetical protein
MQKELRVMKLFCLAAAIIGLAGVGANAVSGPWDQPTATLADHIAAILGPGPAHLTIQNLSSIPTTEIPAIRRLLAQDLKAHGITAAGVDSANAVRVTLSESAHERLLVAEIVEGNQTQVAMVDLGPMQPQAAPASGGLTLLSQQILATPDPVLAAAESPTGLVVLEPSQLVLFARSASGWQELKRVSIEPRRQLARDPRGILVISPGNQSFDAWLPGTRCQAGSSTDSAQDWSPQCHPSDDPWPIAQAPVAQSSTSLESPAGASAPSLSAFYNASRDYFTGIVTPGIGVDLPPFYSAALIPRSAGSGALVIGGIDGKVQLAENGALKTVTGTRDWGSDFAVLRSECGGGTEIIASGSGEAVTDSLRAYELPALEAIPASSPLAMDGAVMSLWTAPDGKSVLAVVRNTANQYEVDRVTALCN